MIEVRPMVVNEVRQLVAWAGREGWNPGLSDAEVFWRLDPDGYLALVEDGQLAGGGAIVRHGAMFGFMGLFIVDEPYRGRGLGTRLWHARRDRLLSRLSDGGTIGLDGVDAMVPFYEKGGFVPYTRHRRFRMSVAIAAPSPAAQIVELSQVSLTELADYDRCGFPVRRERFLADWVAQPDVKSLAVLKADRLVGYGVMRPCLVGWKIGPLFADDVEIAEGLLLSLAELARGEPVFLDVPDCNPAAMTLCERLHMEEVFGCVRMYLGPAPVLDHQRIFAITTLETA